MTATLQPNCANRCNNHVIIVLLCPFPIRWSHNELMVVEFGRSRVSRRVGGTSSVVVSAEQRWRRATNSDVGRRLLQDTPTSFFKTCLAFNPRDLYYQGYKIIIMIVTVINLEFNDRSCDRRMRLWLPLVFRLSHSRCRAVLPQSNMATCCSTSQQPFTSHQLTILISIIYYEIVQRKKCTNPHDTHVQ